MSRSCSDYQPIKERNYDDFRKSTPLLVLYSNTTKVFLVRKDFSYNEQYAVGVSSLSRVIQDIRFQINTIDFQSQINTLAADTSHL